MNLPKMDVIEMVRAFGEIKQSLGNIDNEFVKWVMRVGESRNILNNALQEFRVVLDVMDDVQRSIPQFHKQPGSFREMQAQVMVLMKVIAEVNKALSYVQEMKEPCNDCQAKADDEGDDDDYDE